MAIVGGGSWRLMWLMDSLMREQWPHALHFSECWRQPLKLLAPGQRADEMATVGSRFALSASRDDEGSRGVLVDWEGVDRFRLLLLS